MSGTLVAMLGAIIIAIVVVVLIPVGFLMSMVLPASIFGLLLKNKAEADHAESELVNTNY